LNGGIDRGDREFVTQRYQGNFAKIALNAVRKTEAGNNELAKILRGWFGTEVGKSGTDLLVAREPIVAGGSAVANSSGSTRRAASRCNCTCARRRR
jgi:hypothetical protein